MPVCAGPDSGRGVLRWVDLGFPGARCACSGSAATADAVLRLSSAHAQTVKQPLRRLRMAVEDGGGGGGASNQMLVLMLVAMASLRLCSLATAQPLCRCGRPSGFGVLPGVGKEG